MTSTNWGKRWGRGRISLVVLIGALALIHGGPVPDSVAPAPASAPAPAPASAPAVAAAAGPALAPAPVIIVGEIYSLPPENKVKPNTAEAPAASPSDATPIPSAKAPDTAGKDGNRVLQFTSGFTGGLSSTVNGDGGGYGTKAGQKRKGSKTGAQDQINDLVKGLKKDRPEDPRAKPLEGYWASGAGPCTCPSDIEIERRKSAGSEFQRGFDEGVDRVFKPTAEIGDSLTGQGGVSNNDGHVDVAFHTVQGLIGGGAGTAIDVAGDTTGLGDTVMPVGNLAGNVAGTAAGGWVFAYKAGFDAAKVVAVKTDQEELLGMKSKQTQAAEAQEAAQSSQSDSSSYSQSQSYESQSSRRKRQAKGAAKKKPAAAPPAAKAKPAAAPAKAAPAKTAAKAPAKGASPKAPAAAPKTPAPAPPAPAAAPAADPADNPQGAPQVGPDGAPGQLLYSTTTTTTTTTNDDSNQSASSSSNTNQVTGQDFGIAGQNVAGITKTFTTSRGGSEKDVCLCQKGLNSLQVKQRLEEAKSKALQKQDFLATATQLAQNPTQVAQQAQGLANPEQLTQLAGQQQQPQPEE